MAITEAIPVWIDEVVKSYEDDARCIELIGKLSIDPTAVTHFSLQNGILMHDGKLVIGNTGNLKKQLLHSFHNSALGGHSGERATYHRLKLVFY